MDLPQRKGLPRPRLQGRMLQRPARVLQQDPVPTSAGSRGTGTTIPPGAPTATTSRSSARARSPSPRPSAAARSRATGHRPSASFGSAPFVTPTGFPRSSGNRVGNSSSSTARPPGRQRQAPITASRLRAAPSTRAANSRFMRRAGTMGLGPLGSASVSMASRGACKDRSTSPEGPWTAATCVPALPGCAGSSLRHRGTSASRTTTDARDRGCPDGSDRERPQLGQDDPLRPHRRRRYDDGDGARLTRQKG